MRYQGGKSRIAREISELISALRGGGTFISLFCGSCAVEAKVKGFNRVILNDKHKYLIALLRAVQNDYNPPDMVTEEEYAAIKANKDADPAALGYLRRSALSRHDGLYYGKIRSCGILGVYAGACGLRAYGTYQRTTSSVRFYNRLGETVSAFYRPQQRQ